MPVTPIIGVRISCDMAARNDDLARLASSAASARLDRDLLGVLAGGDVGLARRSAIALNAPATRSSSDTPRTSARSA